MKRKSLYQNCLIIINCAVHNSYIMIKQKKISQVCYKKTLNIIKKKKTVIFGKAFAVKSFILAHIASSSLFFEYQLKMYFWLKINKKTAVVWPY